MKSFIRQMTQIVDFFIHPVNKDSSALEDILNLNKLRLLVSIALASLLLLCILTWIELTRATTVKDLLLLSIDVAVPTGFLVFIKHSKNVFKMLPYALYLFLAMILYFTQPEELSKGSAVWFPFLIFCSGIMTNFAHTTLVTGISGLSTAFWLIWASVKDQESPFNYFEQYLEIGFIICLSYILMIFYVKMNQTSTKLLSDAKDALMAEKMKRHGSAQMSLLGNVAGGLAHEFNNPFAIILGYTSKLKILAEKQSLSATDVVNCSERIESTVDRIATLTKTLNQLALRTSSDTTTVQDLVNNVKERMSQIMNSDEITFKVTLERDLRDTEIECFLELFTEALLEVTTNAFEFLTNKKGEKEKEKEEEEKEEVKWIELQVSKIERKILFSISNNGLKIKERDFTLMKQPFYTNLRQIGKLGMGLSLAEATAAIHGGELFLDTQSTFTKIVLTLDLDHAKGFDERRLQRS